MGKRVLEVAPHFLVELCKAPGNWPRACTVDDALPGDVRFISAHIGDDAQTVLLIVDSTEWVDPPEGERLPRVRPTFTVHREEPPKVPEANARLRWQE